MRHEEMTSSFVQYDVGNLVLMLNSYLATCVFPINIVHGCLLCRSVIPLYVTGARHRIPSTKFSTVSVSQLYT